jgi:hypothetical protein
MLGWINQMLQEFIVDTFGEGVWQQVLEKCDVPPDKWVSTCPYSDSYTYG